MHRREFAQRLAIGVVGASIPGFKRTAGTSLSASAKTEKKQWAAEYLKGMENLFMPSFSPDFKKLEEEGIRHERRRMIEIVRAESGQKIMTSVIVGGTEQARSKSWPCRFQRLRIVHKHKCKKRRFSLGKSALQPPGIGPLKNYRQIN